MGSEGILNADIRATFCDEVKALGGVVSEAVEVGPAFFARSIMESVEEVRTGDQVRGGVALQSTGRSVFVHPYVFRLVCTNGCIMANMVGTEQLELGEFSSAEEADEAIRHAIRACASPERFSASARQMRTAREIRADLIVSLLPMMERLGVAGGHSVFADIIARFVRDEEQSAFGLVNAVTSVARDTRDPQQRWQLEELGGGLLIGLPRAPRVDGSRARSQSLVTV